MVISSFANLDQQASPRMPSPRQHPRQLGLQTTLSLASSGAYGSHDMQQPLSNSDHTHDSPSDSTNSRETWPVETGLSIPLNVKENEEENDYPERQGIHLASISDKLSLQEVVRERVELISDKMDIMPNELLEELKSDLRKLLEGTGGPHLREEFLSLQQHLHGRFDLNAKSLTRAHRVQLEILIAINTGILAFLHPNVCLSQSHLIEVFLYKKCRNIACQSLIPADDCSCQICANRNGFCNLCMCIICNKFDFEVNTYRWIGCDFCAHWTHSDCAMHVGQIGMGASGVGEMHFRCMACDRTSELLGWVKDVFQHCAPGWDRAALMRELELVSRIFHLCDDPRGRKLHRKCNDVVEMMKNGATESMAYKILLLLFQDLEIESRKNHQIEDSGRAMSADEACNRIAEVIQDTVKKMEMVSVEKLQMLKRARVAVEACDGELEDKAKEVTELKLERQRKKLQLEELESLVRLKQAEAEMFQLKAAEARQEAERLQLIASAKSGEAEHDFTSIYLKRRLAEAEAEKQYMLEKIKLQESQRSGVGSSDGGGAGEPSQMPANFRNC